MAVAFTGAGTATAASGASPQAVTTVTALAVGDALVALIAYDNSGTSGADPMTGTITPTPVTGVLSASVSAQTGLNDPGAASAGVAARCVAWKVTTAIPSGTVINFAWTGTVVVRAIALMKVAGAGSVINFRANNAATGVNGVGVTTVAHTTPSVTSGEGVLCWAAHENGAAITGDADTTNGSWSAVYGAFTGTTAAGMAAYFQSKVVTATATQTFNPTGTSSDWIVGSIIFTETVSVSTTRATTWNVLVSAPTQDATHPKLYYDFSGSGNTVTDMTGNGQTGSMFTGSSPAPTDLRSSGQLLIDSTYETLKYVPIVGPTKASLTFKFRPSQTNGNCGLWVLAVGADSSGFNLFMQADHLEFIGRAASGVIITGAISGSTMVANTDYQIAATYDAAAGTSGHGKLVFYLNGVAVFTDTSTFTGALNLTSVSGSGFCVGYNPFMTAPNGAYLFDDIRWWDDYTLTAAEVLAIAAGPTKTKWTDSTFTNINAGGDYWTVPHYGGNVWEYAPVAGIRENYTFGGMASVRMAAATGQDQYVKITVPEVNSEWTLMVRCSSTPGADTHLNGLSVQHDGGYIQWFDPSGTQITYHEPSPWPTGPGTVELRVVSNVATLSINGVAIPTVDIASLGLTNLYQGFGSQRGAIVLAAEGGDYPPSGGGGGTTPVTASRTTTWNVASTGGGGTVYSDDFNRANGTLTTPWVNVDSTHSIVSNKVPVGPADPTVSKYNATFTADQWAEIDVAGRVVSGSTMFPAARITPTGDFYYIWVNGSAVSFFKRISGTYTKLGGDGSVVGSAFKVRLEVEGTTLRAYADGVLALTTTDSSIAAGLPGIISSGGAGATADNFRAGDLSGGTTPVTTTRATTWNVNASASAPFSDNFNRADGALGSPWVVLAGEPASPPISGNRVIAPGTGVNCGVTVTTPSYGANQWARASCSLGPDYSEVGVILHAHDSTTTMMWIYTTDGQPSWLPGFGSTPGPAVQMYQYYAGGSAWRFLGQAPAPASGTHVMYGINTGRRFQLWFDGVRWFDVDDTGHTELDLLGMPGFTLHRGAVGVETSLDDFACGEYTTAPAPTLTSFTPSTAAPGAVVNVVGTNFIADATSVYLGESGAVALTVTSPTTGTFIVPNFSPATRSTSIGTPFDFSSTLSFTIALGPWFGSTTEAVNNTQAAHTSLTVAAPPGITGAADQRVFICTFVGPISAADPVVTPPAGFTAVTPTHADALLSGFGIWIYTQWFVSTTNHSADANFTVTFSSSVIISRMMAGTINNTSGAEAVDAYASTMSTSMALPSLTTTAADDAVLAMVMLDPSGVLSALSGFTPLSVTGVNAPDPTLLWAPQAVAGATPTPTITFTGTSSALIAATSAWKKSVSLTPVTTARSTTWNVLSNALYLSDDFSSGTTASTPPWTIYNRLSDQINEELNAVIPANVRVSSGTLKIDSKFEDVVAGDTTTGPPNPRTMHYSSGQIAQSLAPFKYGEVQVRAKIPGGTGLWPCIWMLGYLWQESQPYTANVVGADWPNAVGWWEIDIAEFVLDHRSLVNNALHFVTANRGSSGEKSLPFDATTRFMVYRLVWTPTSLTWYVDAEDGAGWRTTTTITGTPGTDIPNTWGYLIIHTAIGGFAASTPNPATFPQTMEVDYARVLRTVDTLILVTATRTTSWKTLSSVSTSRSTTWRTLAPVSTTRATTWNALVGVSTTRPTVWRVLASVSVTRPATWRVIQTITVTRPTSWNVAGALFFVSTNRATTWVTRALVSTPRPTTWSVLVALATPASRPTTWNTLAGVSTPRPTTWVTRALVPVARPTTWNVLAPVPTVTRTTTWSAAAQVVVVRPTSWNVAGTLVFVMTSRPTTWGVQERITSSRPTTWQVLNPVAGAVNRSTTWAVLTTVSGVSRPTTWRVFLQVSVLRSASWNVAGSLFFVQTARSALWDVRVLISAPRPTTWNTYVQAAALRVALWRVLRTVPTSRQARWNVAAPILTVTVSRVARWNVAPTAPSHDYLVLYPTTVMYLGNHLIKALYQGNTKIWP